MNLTEDIKADIATGTVLAMTIRSIQSSMGAMLQIVDEEDFKTLISSMTEGTIKAHKTADKQADEQLKKHLTEFFKSHRKKVKK